MVATSIEKILLVNSEHWMYRRSLDSSISVRLLLLHCACRGISDDVVLVYGFVWFGKLGLLQDNVGGSWTCAAFNTVKVYSRVIECQSFQRANI